eukprot:SAG11_NODE_35706_length_265_cov_0.927711_1_plen_88_part_11
MLKMGFISATFFVVVIVVAWVKVFSKYINIGGIFRWWTHTSAQADLKIVFGLSQIISQAPIVLDISYPVEFMLIIEFMQVFSLSFTNL